MCLPTPGGHLLLQGGEAGASWLLKLATEGLSESEIGRCLLCYLCQKEGWHVDSNYIILSHSNCSKSACVGASCHRSHQYLHVKIVHYI